MKAGPTAAFMVVSAVIITNSLTTAQFSINTSTQSTNNPLDIFNFKPQALLTFLWDSLKADYKTEVNSTLQGLDNVGNISQLIQDVILEVANNSEMAKSLLNATATQKLLKLVESDGRQFINTMDLTNLTDIQGRLLQQINLTKYSQALIRPLLFDLQKMRVFENITSDVDRLLSDLEMGSRSVGLVNARIGDEIVEIVNLVLSMAGNRTSGFGAQLSGIAVKSFLSEPIKELSAALIDVTKTLSTSPDWASMANGEKLMMIVTKFNYKEYGEKLISIGLGMAQDSLPSGEVTQLRDFLEKLDTMKKTKSLGVKRALSVLLPASYKAVRGQLLTINPNMTLPATFPLDLAQLDSLRLYEAIESALYDSMEKIMMDPALNATWIDTSGVTDMERLYMIMTNVDYRGVGQTVIGNILDTISKPDKLKPMLYEQVGMIWELISNQTQIRGYESLGNSTADNIAQSLLDSYNIQNQTANWTQLENSKRLVLVLTKLDYPTLGSRMFAAVLEDGEQRLRLSNPDFVRNVTEVLSLVSSNDTVEITRRLQSVAEEVIMALWNTTLPARLSQTKDKLLSEVSSQLIQTYQDISMDQSNMTLVMLSATQTNFTDLSDLQKMAYTAVSVDFQAIGTVLISELNSILENRSTELLALLAQNTSIYDDLYTFSRQITKVFFIPLSEENLNSPVVKVLLEDINEQFSDMYSNFTQSMIWQSNNFSSSMKLMNLMMAYDYTEAGNKMFWEYLSVADSRIAVNVRPKLDDMIQKIANQQSITYQLEKLRDIYGGVAQLSFLKSIPVDILQPIYSEIDRQIASLNKTSLEEWKNIPGTLQKVAKFASNINTTSLGRAVLGTVGRMAQNNVIDQLSDALPANITRMISGYILTLESGGLNETVQKALNSVIGGNGMLKFVVENPVVQGVAKSLMSSIITAYDKAVKSGGSGWRSLSTAAKFMRILREMDVADTFEEASTIGSQTLSSTMEYYNRILNPNSTFLTPECAADLSRFTSDLMKITSGDKSYMWAGEMIDAWGKPPSGILRGRFKWPGEMNECVRIKADRRRVQPDGTIISDKDAIRGGWTMVGIKLSALGGIGGEQGLFATMPGGPTLDLGICLPASCTYSDINVTMSRVKAIGGSLSYIKRRADYPSVNGAWKTDPKFIGVSVMFGLLIGIVTLSTFVDGYLRMRAECCEDEKTDKKKSEKIALGNMAESEKPNSNGSTVYDGADKVTDEHTSFQNKAFEAEYGDSDVEATKSNGHTNECKESQEPAPPTKPPPKAKMGIGMQLMKSFSLYETLPKLMDSTPKPNQLQGLDGIRFLSMTWVILGHVYGLSILPGVVQNLRDGAEWGKEGDWGFQFVPAGLYAVDSFFLMSGLLVGYLFLKTLSKIKKKEICVTMVLYYVHRYIRLLPLYAGVILISIGYSNYIGSGPFNTFFVKGYFENPCETNWWTNLLYINNLYKNKGQEMCNGVSWYLANDMQFYWISPLLLFPLYWVPKLGFVLIFAVFAGHIGVTGWAWSLKDGGSQMSDQSIFTDIYIKPWARIGPYLIGLVLAYILFNKHTIKSRFIRAVWWMVSLGGIALCVYIPYDATKEGGITTSSWNSTQRAAYETLCKSGWAVCLGWIIFACNTNSRGPLGAFLSWSGWAPLSKLTYAAYLIHPFVLDLNWKNRFNLLYFEHFTLIFHDITMVFLSYACGAVVHLLLEAPMLGLERLILPRRK